MAQQMVAKKLLRASYSLIMYRDKQWFDDPIECGTHFLRYHPEKQLEIDRLGLLLKPRAIPKRSVLVYSIVLALGWCLNIKKPSFELVSLF